MLIKVVKFMSGQGTAFLLMFAMIFGLIVGNWFSIPSDMLLSWIDNTIFLLVFLLLFEVCFENILASLKRIKFIVIALILNFLIIPVLGFVIATVFFPNQPLFFIGLLIYFMMPCTDWFLGFTRLANGNTVLGAALIPINMVLQLLLYPIYLTIFGVDIIDTNTVTVFSILLHWFLMPFILAISLRFLLAIIPTQKPLYYSQMSVSIMIPIVLAFLVGQLFADNVGTLIEYSRQLPWIIFAIILFFILVFYLSKFVSQFMNFKHEDRVLLTMTTASRNAPIMLALTIAVIPDQPIIYATIIIGMLIEFPHLIRLKIMFNKQYKRISHQQDVI